MNHQQLHPIERSNLLERIWFSWLNVYIEKTRTQQNFEQSMHSELPSQDKSTSYHTKMKNGYMRNTNILGVILTVFKSKLAIICGFTLVDCAFYGLKLYLLILIGGQLEEEFKTNGRIKDWPKLLTTSLVTAGTSILSELVLSSNNFLIGRYMNQIRNSISCLVYDKILRIRIVGSETLEQGRLITTVINDSDKVCSMAITMNQVLYLSLNLLISVIIGVYYFSWLFLLLFSLMFTLVLVPNTLIYSHMKSNTSLWLASRDRTLSKFKQFYNSISYIKLRSFELEALEILQKLRGKELSHQFVNFTLFAIVMFSNILGTGIAVFIFFKIFVLMDFTLEVSQVAFFLRLIMELKNITGYLPPNIRTVGEILVSSSRIDAVLSHEEIDFSLIKNKKGPSLYNYDIEISKVVFYWKRKVKKTQSKDGTNEEKKDVKAIYSKVEKKMI